jgi:3-methyladenine DNA glycosylase/8-oxoguanine DNA glycosylase
MSLHKQLLKRFRERFREGKNDFVNSQTIQDYAHEHFRREDNSQYKHEYAGRLLRKMAEDKEIEPKIIDGKNTESVFYRYIPDDNEIISVMMKNENR